MPWPPEDPDMWAVEARFKDHSKKPVEEPVKQKEIAMSKKLPVMEVFGPTIQGEGAMCGFRTSFIRFGLCDYKCTMCDSMHAVDPLKVKANAEWLTPDEIVDKIVKVHDPDNTYMMNADWITFSGGNPCVHDLTEVIMRIRGLDITHGKLQMAVETQGTLWQDWLLLCDVVTVSPKSPGMGEQFEADKFAKFVLKLKHHEGFNVKVVVFSQQDIEFAKHINNIMVDEGLGDRMYMSLGNPMPPGLDHPEGDPPGSVIPRDDLRIQLMNSYEVLCEDMLQDASLRNVKFLPQMHVLVWGNKMGV